MKRLIFPLFSLLLLVVWLGSCCAQPAHEAIYQVATIDALKKGAYDGPTTIGDLKKRGDFGLGTVNGLDGEVVAVDGQFYQVTSDGKVHLLPDSAETPFAVVTFFDGEKQEKLSGVKNLAELQERINSVLPDDSAFYAVRIEGTFTHVKARSVPRQTKPYVPLLDALKGQTVFRLTKVKGTLVGFRFPASMKEVNVPGYHFHFVSQDRKSGGHVLDCAAASCLVQWVGRSDLWIKIPAGK
jgi:acetolactate decarboxylase